MPQHSHEQELRLEATAPERPSLPVQLGNNKTMDWSHNKESGSLENVLPTVLPPTSPVANSRGHPPIVEVHTTRNTLSRLSPRSEQQTQQGALATQRFSGQLFAFFLSTLPSNY